MAAYCILSDKARVTYKVFSPNQNDSTPGLLTELQIDYRNSAWQSTDAVLVPGRNYLFRGIGAGIFTTNAFIDAAGYKYRDGALLEPNNSANPRINFTQSESENIFIEFSWAGVNPVYEKLLVAQADRLYARLADNPYGDNSGGALIEIYDYGFGCIQQNNQSFAVELLPFLQWISVLEPGESLTGNQGSFTNNSANCLEVYLVSINYPLNSAIDPATVPDQEKSVKLVKTICSASSCPTPQYEVSCGENNCPDGTCQIRCADRLCCYNSQGKLVKTILL